MSQYHNNLVINTKTLEVVQAQHIIYSVLNLVLLLISNLVAGGARHCSAPVYLLGGRINFTLHRAFAADAIGSRELYFGNRGGALSHSHSK